MNMLVLVWYPLDFFKLSFESADSFKRLAEEMTSHREAISRMISSGI